MAATWRGAEDSTRLSGLGEPLIVTEGDAPAEARRPQVRSVRQPQDRRLHALRRWGVLAIGFMALGCLSLALAHNMWWA